MITAAERAQLIANHNASLQAGRHLDFAPQVSADEDFIPSSGRSELKATMEAEYARFLAAGERINRELDAAEERAAGGARREEKARPCHGSRPAARGGKPAGSFFGLPGSKWHLVFLQRTFDPPR